MFFTIACMPRWKCFSLTQCTLYHDTQPNVRNMWVQDKKPIDCTWRTNGINCTTIPADHRSNDSLRPVECNISLALPHPEWIDATPNRSDFHSDALFPYRQWCLPVRCYFAGHLYRCPYGQGRIWYDDVSEPL